MNYYMVAYMKFVLIVLCVTVLFSSCASSNTNNIDTPNNEATASDDIPDLPLNDTENGANTPEDKNAQDIPLYTEIVVFIGDMSDCSANDLFTANIESLTTEQVYQDNQNSILTYSVACLYGEYIIFITGLGDSSAIVYMRDDGSDCHILYVSEGSYSIGSISCIDYRTIAFTKWHNLVFFDLLLREEVDYKLPAALATLDDISRIARFDKGIIAYDRIVYTPGSAEYPYYLNNQGVLVSIMDSKSPWRDSYSNGIFYYQLVYMDYSEFYKFDLSTGIHSFILESNEVWYDDQLLIGKWLIEVVDGKIELTDLENASRYYTNIKLKNGYFKGEEFFIHNDNVYILTAKNLYCFNTTSHETSEICVIYTDLGYPTATVIKDTVMLLNQLNRTAYMFSIDGSFLIVFE